MDGFDLSVAIRSELLAQGDLEAATFDLTRAWRTMLRFAEQRITIDSKPVVVDRLIVETLEAPHALPWHQADDNVRTYVSIARHLQPSDLDASGDHHEIALLVGFAQVCEAFSAHCDDRGRGFEPDDPDSRRAVPSLPALDERVVSSAFFDRLRNTSAQTIDLDSTL